jgi:hypothetical protein
MFCFSPKYSEFKQWKVIGAALKAKNAAKLTG